MPYARRPQKGDDISREEACSGGGSLAREGLRDRNSDARAMSCLNPGPGPLDGSLTQPSIAFPVTSRVRGNRVATCRHSRHLEQASHWPMSCRENCHIHRQMPEKRTPTRTRPRGRRTTPPQTFAACATCREKCLNFPGSKHGQESENAIRQPTSAEGRAQLRRELSFNSVARAQ